MEDAQGVQTAFCVEVMGQEKDGLRFEIGPEGLLVGRSSTCDVIFKDREVSRRHAYFYADRGFCYVEDLGAKNGVLVNGTAVKKERLADGDTVDTGPIRFILHVGGPEDMFSTWTREIPDARGRRDVEPTTRGSLVLTPFKHTLAISSLAFGVLAYLHWVLGVGAVLLALLAILEMRGQADSTGRVLALGGLIVGIVGGSMNGWFVELAPRLRESKQLAIRAACRENLREIWRALGNYRRAHEGFFPAGLEDLVKEGLLDQEWLQCPGCRFSGMASCGYLFPAAGAGPSDRPLDVLVCDTELASHQNEGGLALRSDGWIRWLPRQQFMRLLTELHEAPPPPFARGRGRGALQNGENGAEG